MCEAGTHRPLARERRVAAPIVGAPVQTGHVGGRAAQVELGKSSVGPHDVSGLCMDGAEGRVEMQLKIPV